MKKDAYIHLVIKTPEGTKYFDVPAAVGMTLLDALCYAQEKIDSSISFRWNCRTGQCGICAVQINGVPKLACMEKANQGCVYQVEPISIERHLQGLVCEVSDLYKEYFLTSTAIGHTELERKLAFEQLLLKIRSSTTPILIKGCEKKPEPNEDIIFDSNWLDEIENLRSCLWAATRHSWFLECFKDNKPRYVPTDYPHRALLLKYGLVDSTGKARYRINIIRNSIFITDGPWYVHKGGVFPYLDESELI